MKLCQVCHKQITNPVHPERVLQQIEQWLYESAPYLVNTLSVMRQTLPVNYKIRPNQRCIHTEKDVHVCPSCTVDHAKQWLKTANAPQGVIKRYNELFTYDIIGRTVSEPVKIQKPLHQEKPLQTSEIPEYL